MKCSFCGKELERGTQECPYCHCSIEAEVQVLRPEERDTFAVSYTHLTLPTTSRV